MKKSFIACLLVSVVALNCPSAQAKQDEIGRKLDATRIAVGQHSRQFAELLDKHGTDVETLLGIAYINKIFPAVGFSYKDAMNRALLAAPNNRAALMMKADSDTSSVLGRRSSALKMFAIKEEGVVKQGMEEMEIWSVEDSLYSIFKKNDPFVRVGPEIGEDGQEDKSIYYIKDVETARRVLVQRLEEPIPSLLSWLDAASLKDPENPIYDYLKARVFLETGQEQQAVEAIEASFKKKTPTMYEDELKVAAEKVLTQLAFSEGEKSFFLSGRTTMASFVLYTLWEDKVESVVKSSIKAHDFAKAKKMYELMIRIAQQIQGENESPLEVSMKEKLDGVLAEEQLYNQVDSEDIKTDKDGGDVEG